MRSSTMMAACLILMLAAAPLPAETPDAKVVPAPEPLKTAPARDRGLAWLAKNQSEDGSWGRAYKTTVTSFACLAFLAASDDPYAGDGAKPLVKGLAYLMSRQKDGVFGNEGHSWIHVQGFATLALSEAWGRTLLCETKPDLDRPAMKVAVTKAVAAIAKHQSTSGGWWYTPGSPAQHEGSTTVTAVQALASARNFGIPIDATVLAKGFAYLKKCQNKDGGFDYMLNAAEVSMKEGTAADVATLGLMRKFDYPVMMDAYRFLLKLRPQAISRERFPYYGHFYGCMGMRLMLAEFPSFKKDIDGYIDGAYRDVVSWQAQDGSWPIKGWMVGKETPAYATSFAAMLLSASEGRLSIFNRDAPKLPVVEKPKSD
jgi:hypothetical protein